MARKQFLRPSQMGTGRADDDTSAVLQLTSTTSGFLPPRMTSTQRDAISSPATGLTIYNTTTNTLQIYNGSAWGDSGDVDAGGNGLVVQTGTGTYTARTLTGPAAGITVSNGSGVSGNPTLALANDLAALEAMAGTGIVARTASETYAQRTLTAPAAGFTITDGNGVSGNPTFVLANDLAALEGLSTNGLVVRTGDGTATTRAITGTANEITVGNGDGVSGAPTLSLPAALTFTGKTITGGTYTGAALNGSLGATTPSTVAATTISASGQVTSTLAGGTMPLAVTSTTMCTNLNSELHDGYTAEEMLAFNYS
ncbi:MAG TPA: hypothetical protein VEA16_08850 [Vicinamibacterales bacterium]|nr:hypothetical protein [Vicinamibacterales bacterium]